MRRCRFFLGLFVLLLSQAVTSFDNDNDDAVETIDILCGGTRLVETPIVANSTVVVGEVPAGLYRLAIHLWSDEDMDIQMMSGNASIVHWRDGIVYHGEEQSGNYQGDHFVYSGYNGDGFGEGNEFIIFDGFTANEYKFLVHGHTDGRITVRFGWLPMDSCNITEAFYPHLLQEGKFRHHRRNLQSILHDQIDGHTELSYTACWNAIRNTDQHPTDSNKVIGIYSRKGIYKSYQDGSSSCGGDREECWNREHVYPKSRGDFGTNKGAGTDLHALRAEDRSVNTERSNKSFDYIPYGYDWVNDCWYCKETSTQFEPPHAVKGEVARMIFYMAVRWNGDSDSNGVSLRVVDGQPSDPVGSTGYLGDLQSLKEWNRNYPPTSQEYRRNNIIASWYQGNRNPFIDNPSLADVLF